MVAVDAATELEHIGSNAVRHDHAVGTDVDDAINDIAYHVDDAINDIAYHVDDAINDIAYHVDDEPIDAGASADNRVVADNRAVADSAVADNWAVSAVADNRAVADSAVAVDDKRAVKRNVIKHVDGQTIAEDEAPNSATEAKDRDSRAAAQPAETKFRYRRLTPVSCVFVR